MNRMGGVMRWVPLALVVGLVVVFPALFMAGCSTVAALTGEPTEGQKVDLATAQAGADAKRADAARALSEERRDKVEAIKAMAQGGGDAARVAGLMTMMTMERQQQAAQPVSSVVVQPRSPGLLETMFPWVRLFADIRRSDQAADVAMRQSDNAAKVAIAQSADGRAVSEASYDALQGTAGMIQAPAPNVTIGGNGVAGGGTYSDASQTLGGNGVLGDGSLNANMGTGAAGGDYGDSSGSNNPVDSSNQGNSTAEPFTVQPIVVQTGGVAP